MAIDNTISIPYTVTGGISSGDNAGVNTLSGYTGKLSVFNFQLDPSTTNLFNFAPHLSNDKFVWDLGDGTRVPGPSAVHTYNFPGVYTTSLVAYTSAGEEYLSTVTKEISVGNFFDNTLDINNDDVVNIFNVNANDKSNRLNITRQSSWQPHNALSAIGYTVNFYASGSNSNKLNIDDYNNFKWNHLNKTWSFFTPSTSNNGTILYTPTESIETTYEEIYVRETIIDSSQTFVRVTSSFLASPSGNQAVFVGTSGTGEIVYSDSSPKLTKQPVFIYGYVDYSRYPDHKYLNGDFPSTDKLKYFEQFNLTIPVRVKYNNANKIQFTSSSISSMPLSKIKYNLTEVPFFINLIDVNGNIVQNYNPLNVNPNTGGITDSQTAFVVNLSCLSGSNSQFTDVTLLSTHYYKISEVGIPTNIDGAFKGHLVPVNTSDNAKLNASVKINNIPNYPKDINFGFFFNKDLGKTIRVFFRDNYTSNKLTGSIENTETVDITPLTAIRGDVFDMTDSSNPVSVVFDSDNINKSHVTAYMTSTSSSLISAFTTYLTTKKTFANNVAFVKPSFNTQNISDVYYFNSIGPNGNNYSHAEALIDPTYISVDNNRNAYLACPEICLVQYLSSGYSSSPIVDVITNIDTNRTYTNVLSGESKLSVSDGIDIVEDTEGNKNLYHPSLVDAGLYNTVWVCNTNPFSASIVQYHKTTDDNILPTPVYTYEFNQPLAPTDICVDNRNNCWVSVENKHRHLRGYVNEGDINDYDRSLSARTDGTKGNLGVTCTANKSDDEFSYIIQTISFSVSSNELIEVIGFDGSSANAKYYDGTFLVTSVSANPDKTKVVVEPYTGIYNQAATTTTAATISAFKRPSDRVYKFDSSGSKIATVSGFLNPEHIVVDGNQNLWVSHNTDTITQINTAGAILSSIKVRNDNFLTNYVSAGSDLVKAHRGTVTTINALSTVQHHIGGLSLDTYENLLVLNSFENRLYKIPINSVSLSASYPIGCDMSPASAVHGFTYGKLEGKGDWTGYRWLNKYKNTYGENTITGDTTFGIYSSGGQYKLRKVNENFDPIETIKSYRSADHLFDQNILFDEFLSSIVGTVSSDSDALGRVIYEKIANFVDNISDPETCNVNSLYSLFDQFNLNINNYNLKYPGKLQRIVNLLSIPHHKLWGQLEKFDREIDLSSPGLFDLPNIGDELTFNSYVVSADQPIIARHIFTNSYEKIDTHNVTPFSENGWGSKSSPHYLSKFDVVSAYPLSAFNPYWGWGLDKGVSGADITQHIKFFEYKNIYSDRLIEGVIDWNNPQTTLSRSNSGINDWTKDYGIVESLIDVELRKGLNLFNISLSSYSPGVL